MAVQTRLARRRSVSAWAGHWQLRRVAARRRRRRASLGEYNFASGDADPTDGTRGTFDQLYPTAHDKYGLADQVGWRNIHHLRSRRRVDADSRRSSTASYHSWWLAETRRRPLQRGRRASLARVAAGARRRHVGQEIDLQVSRR